MISTAEKCVKVVIVGAENRVNRCNPQRSKDAKKHEKTRYNEMSEIPVP